MRTVTIGCGLLLLGAGPAFGDLPGEWCRTIETWRARAGAPIPVSDVCPGYGDCDTPKVRDGFIPGKSTVLRTIRLHLVVLRDDAGGDPAATEQQVVEQMVRMNNDFAASGFAFQYTWEYVDDSQFRYGDDVVLMKELYAEDPQHQCNVFVCGSSSFGTFPWDLVAWTAQGGIVLAANWIGGDVSVISHEMGHNLGLWHTHTGTTEVNFCGPCWEQADGVDGDITGDFCSDTPSTPRSDQCTDPDGGDECSGLKWGLTLPESYMSYGNSCWSLFTPQQAGRMQCWFESVLRPWLVTCPGDGNGDGAVSFIDFQGLVLAWGAGPSVYDVAPAGGDGIVDIKDFVGILALWGPCK